MFSPFGNGHHPGATPGTWEEPGDRSLARVPGPGGRRVAPGKAGQLASQRGEAGQGPSISYVEGPCLILAGRAVFAGTATASRRPPGCATAMVRSHHRVRRGLWPEADPGGWWGWRVRFQLVSVVAQAG
jgi:hypothetical protein